MKMKLKSLVFTLLFTGISASTVIAIEESEVPLAASSLQSSDAVPNHMNQVFGYDINLYKSTIDVPLWLSQFTCMKQWPTLDPPYIPLDFIDFAKIPNIPPYGPTECPLSRDTCSFDCHGCVSHDDVYTCRKLSQTFDDGPSPMTNQLLDNLKFKSTFFNLGINVVRFPDIYQRLNREGHLLGSHTWSHKFLPSLTNEQIIAQFEWSIWAMNATGNHLPKYYRPPYGAIDDRVRSIARMFGMQAVLWDHDLNDWKLENVPAVRTKEDVYNDARSYKAENKGGIILEHDSFQTTVDAAIEVSKILGNDQLTVAQCANSIDYIKVYPNPNRNPNQNPN